jgi:tetratricopeptide (TPR) repeat protein
MGLLRSLVLAASVTLALLVGVRGPAVAQDVVQADPEAEEAFFRGIGLMEAGNPRAAVAEFETAVTIQPDFRRAYYYRARALIELQDYSGARQSADAYSRFDLAEAEKKQLEALIAEIDKTAPPIEMLDPDEEVLEPPPPDVEPEVEPQPTQAEAARLQLDEGERLLERGECSQAQDAAQAALKLDPSLTRGLRLKGLALECLDQLDRARSILLAYLEISPADQPDAVAVRALERIDIELERRAAEQPEPTPPPTVSTVIGSDPRIEGILQDRWGDRPAAKRPRIRVLPGLGRAEIRDGRLDLAGSRADAEVTRIYADDGLVYSRLRVWGRSGSDTPSWFARAFSELYLSVVPQAGEPAAQVGLPDPRKPTENAGRALAGRHRWEVSWEDDDGDLLLLRLGRCDLPGQRHPVVAENRGCLELVGASGTWTPPAEELGSPEAAAVRLAETPGPVAWDLGVYLGGGAAPGVTTLEEGGALANGEFGADLLALFGLSNFTAGVGFTGSLGLLSASVGDTLPHFHTRVTFYVGVRDQPRQPRWRAFAVGIGMQPDEDLLGRATVSPALSIRIIDQVRVAGLGRFFVSFEPYVVFGVGATRIVPLRFSIGGGMGTKARLARGRQPDEPRW